MHAFWQDLTLAARLLRRSPGFTFGAVVTLALGLGANATVYSLADAILLRQLPVPEPERIVHVYQRRPGRSESFPLSLPDYRDYAEQSRSFETLAAHYPTAPLHVVIDGDPQALGGAVVTASYFEVLRLQPALGRFFAGEEDRVRDRDAVAVISHQLWERRFARGPDVVGRTIRINDHLFTIVGVTPDGFTGVHNGGTATDIWIPSAMFRLGYRYCDAFTRGCTIVDLLGRLAEGVSVEEAQRELDVIAARIASAYPSSSEGLGVMVAPARGRGYGVAASPAEREQLRLYIGAVSLVLLIGCANVAGLLLARGIQRRREIAIRLALGASRARVVRQLLSEGLLIACLGGVLGLLLAFWGKDLVSSFNATDYAGRPLDFRADISPLVVAATAGLTLLTSIIFGLAPALQASRPDVMPVLKDEGASGGGRRARLRQILVVGQIAVAVALGIGAGLLIRSLERVLSGAGFDPRPLVTIRLRPSLVNHPTERALAFQRDVIAKLESLPGVVSASPADGIAATPAPLTGADSTVLLRGISGEADRELRARTFQTRVGPRYFSTLGVRLLAGREFIEADRAGAARVAVVNDVLAREIAPVGVVVGRTLVISGVPHEVVGVVQDAQYYASGQSPHAVVYRSYWQPVDGSFTKDSRTLVRVAGDASAMMQSIRRAVAEVDPSVPISEDYPLSDRLTFAFQSVRTARSVLLIVGTIALVLAAVGLYGVLAFAVGQRTREIGVRVALGASSRAVAVLVLRSALGLAVAGIVAGLIAAWAGARTLSSLLYGVAWSDAAVFTMAPAVLLLVALAASWLPARRAIKVSPLDALRCE